METTGGPAVERELDTARSGGEIPTDTFAARLILARHHAGRLSQREAAERCGLNYASWSNWENGTKVRDKEEVVQRIAEGLGVDRDWLMWGGSLTPPRHDHRSRVRGAITPEYSRLAERWSASARPPRKIGRPAHNRPAAKTAGPPNVGEESRRPVLLARRITP